jgi:hypothetical protein
MNKLQALIEILSGEDLLERGRLCRIVKSSGKVFYNLQAWEKGRNLSKYIRETDLKTVQDAIQRYIKVKKAIDAYLEDRIKISRGHYLKTRKGVSGKLDSV